MADQQTAVLGQAIAQAINNLSNTFPKTSGTSTTATGGSRTLPSNPVIFISVVVDGVTYKIPAYS